MAVSVAIACITERRNLSETTPFEHSKLSILLKTAAELFAIHFRNYNLGYRKCSELG
uniref:Uncharacterized protein n=2 Tax=Rhizophora mucronata TaxID=61149 RepID=A0A2P2JLF2_RHIMU